MELMGFTVWDTSLPEDFLNYRIINTLNAHSFILSKKDSLFRDALNSSDILLPDGIGVVFAAKVLKGKSIRKIAGTDLHLYILEKLNESGGSCFYLGSSEKVLKLISTRLQRDYPHIRAGFFAPPYKSTFSEDDLSLMVEKVNQHKADVLFVGMTAPKQEKWVIENKDLLDCSVICSVGAVFDFFAGTVKRSGPLWIRIGLEFLPRLIREPRRLWRRNLISTPKFLFEILLYRIGARDERS